MKKRAGLATMGMLLCHSACCAQDAPDWHLPTLQPTAITWVPCATSLVSEGALRLGERLSCAVISVPLDHHHPHAGSIDVAIVRVAASDAAKRQGVIFFNPGGPGETPMQHLPSLAQYWDDAYSDHRVHGTKKQLAEQFDLIGVVPRGLEGGTRFTCTSGDDATDYNDIVADPSPANVQAMERYMRATASACRTNPLHRFINTEQTAYDMEVVRLSLGEPRLHYLGYSYGAWLGSWYAAAFPEHVGRMVLDSSMDWTADWDTNVTRAKEASQARFDRVVGEPATNDPARYLLGADVAAVVAQIDKLGYRVRQAWGGVWTTPGDLLGTLTVSDWLRVEPDMSLETLTARARVHRFHRQDPLDTAIRDTVIAHAWRLFPRTHEPRPLGLDTVDSVYSAVMCNDMVYDGDTAHHQARIASLARTFPAIDGQGLQYHCVYWGGPQAARPPLSRLSAVGDILMIHAALDPITPLESATAAFGRTPAARLLIVEDFNEHGVFGFTDSPCVEDTAGRYLLTGILPAGREYRCAAIPAAHGGPGRGFAHPELTATLRSELSGMRSTFARSFGARP
jgi:pimeloyl-ACP methyl ester carboxylesterase